MDDKKRVVVADGQRMVAEAVSRSLEAAGAVRVVSTVCDAAAVLAAVVEWEPELVVLSHELDQSGGAELLRSLVRLTPRPRVVLTAASPAIDSLQRAVDAGCSGYVSKDASLDELLTALDTVASGETFFSADALMTLLRRKEGQQTASPPISDREREVLQLLAEGETISGIARRLHLSAHTVKNHVRRAMAHLGVHTRLEAVLAAARCGLIHLDTDTTDPAVSVTA
jgi:two-component system nitrate/nitrite response regulator NarL